MESSIPTIHVHVPVDKGTAPFARFMWETMLSLANHPRDVKLTVHSMGAVGSERLKDLAQATCVTIAPRGKDPLHGSMGHGAAIMDALAMTGDGDIHVVCDSDTVVVAKGWDDYIRLQAFRGVGMMGTTYEDLGGFSSGSGATQTYKKVPTFTWAMLNPKHDWRTLEVMPNKNHIIAIKTELQSKIYNLPVGYSVFGEAAWQVPQFLHDNNINYDGWRQLKPTKDAIVLRGLGDYHEEYHAEGNTVPFVVHHRGSMKHAYRSDKISSAFYGAVDRYLNTERERPTRWTWEGKGYELERLILPALPTTSGQVEDTYIRAAGEWMKVTLDGDVVRVRNAKGLGSMWELPCPGAGTYHVRLEGTVKGINVKVPPCSKVPYLIVARNMTQGVVTFTTGTGASVQVPDGKAWMLTVDIDGVVHVE